jgi:hypothetical protein
LFKFLDEIRGIFFVHRPRKSGIIYDLGHNYQDSTNNGRLGIVIKVGEDVKEVKPGDVIEIEPLRWTQRFTFEPEGELYWITTEDNVNVIVDGLDVREYEDEE